MTSRGFGGAIRRCGAAPLSAACLVALMVGLGLLLTDVLPSTALGRWDAEVPRRLVEYRQQEGISESKIITTLSDDADDNHADGARRGGVPLGFRPLARISGCHLRGGRRDGHIRGDDALHRPPRPRVPHLDEAPPTSSFPSGHTAAAVCFYGSIAAIILWHSRHRWIKVAAVVICAAVPLLIAGSRVYRGMHYPTDVLAGLLLGAIWLTVVIFYRAHPRCRRPAPRHRRRRSALGERVMMRAAIIVNPAKVGRGGPTGAGGQDAGCRRLVDVAVVGNNA